MSDHRQPPNSASGFAIKTSPTTPRQVMPAAIKVFGILNLLYASLTLLITLVTLGPLFMGRRTSNPVVTSMKDDEFFYALFLVLTIAGLMVTVMVAVAGIGLLLNRPWGRSLSVVCGVIDIALTLISLLASYLLLIEPILVKSRESGHQLDTGAVIRAIVFGIVGVVISIFYPVLLLIFMTPHRIVQALYQASGK